MPSENNHFQLFAVTTIATNFQGMCHGEIVKTRNLNFNRKMLRMNKYRKINIRKLQILLIFAFSHNRILYQIKEVVIFH